MTTELRHDILATAWEDFEKMVFQIAHRMAARYHMQFDDLIGPAKLIFVKAYDAYNEDKGSFSNWLTFVLTRQLTTHCTREYKHLAVEEYTEQHTELQSVNANMFLVDLLDRISPDAQHVCSVVLTDLNFTSVISSNNVRSQRTFRKLLRKQLCDELGWDGERAIAAFDELAEALQ